MVCDVCSNEYGRGKGFKGDRFLANHFCCKDCYNNFVTEKDNTPLKKLKDYINAVYPEPEDLPWDWILRQIKSIKKIYNIDEDDIRMVIKYAVEYEDINVQQDQGLGQFIPRYLQASQSFKEKIIKQQEIAANLNIENEWRVVCRSMAKRRKFRER